MPVDTALHIAGLDPTNPTGDTSRKEADDNFRHIKEVLKRDFANIAGAVTASHTELNRLVGVTADVQTQIDGKISGTSPALTGTPTAPTAAPGTSTTQLASTAFVQTAVAAVNAQTGALVDVIVSTASYSISDGQRAILVGAFAQTVTAPAYSDAGRWGIKVANGRADNAINWNGGKHEGISDATMTIDAAGAAFEAVGTNSTYGWGII
jgi:hypothetical protein